MASCSTERWVSTAPYVTLEVTKTADTDTTATLSWTLKYVAPYAASTNGVARDYTITVNGTNYTGTYNINGVTGTKTVRSGTTSVTKGTSSQNVSFSVTFAFNITWSGVRADSKSASSTISVGAKTSYTVSYNANGGSGAPASQTKWYGTNLTLSNITPTRTGYTFGGWNTTSNGSGTNYAKGATYSANAGVTLYAKWTAVTYTVTFNANGGTWPSGVSNTQTKTYGTNLTLSNTKPTRTNYTFKGWATSSSSTTVVYASGATYSANAAITLYAVWELAYVKPRIKNVKVFRSTSNPATASEEGTYASVGFQWASDKTVTSVKIYWKLSSNASYSNSYTVSSVSGTSGTVAPVAIGNNALSPELAYDVKIVVTDGGPSGGNSTEYNTVVPTMNFPIDVYRTGKGVSIGKPATTENIFDVAYKAIFTNPSSNSLGSVVVQLSSGEAMFTAKRTDTNKQLNFGIGSGGTNRGIHDPRQSKWLFYSDSNNDTHVLGDNVSLEGDDVKFAISNVGTPATYKPYLSRGDSYTTTLNTAGYITSSSTGVTFMIPLSMPVIGNPVVTVASNDGIILRQAGKYTHGSAASTWVKPSSYSVTNRYPFGLVVTAIMSNTTDSVNNDAIGVQWSGTITFS